MIDPLFQRVLVSECRSRNIPVIFDEVFTGFWRLGTEVGIPCISFSFVLLLFFLLYMLLSFNVIEVLNYIHFFYFLEMSLLSLLLQSAAELLGCLPDIACFAKLMTGGVIPLAATLASDAVFDSFLGESKVMYSCGFV